MDWMFFFCFVHTIIKLMPIFSDPSLLSGACVHLSELAMEAGLPNGVLNVIHGTSVSSLFVFGILLFDDISFCHINKF